MSEFPTINHKSLHVCCRTHTVIHDVYNDRMYRYYGRWFHEWLLCHISYVTTLCWLYINAYFGIMKRLCIRIIQWLIILKHLQMACFHLSYIYRISNMFYLYHKMSMYLNDRFANCLDFFSEIQCSFQVRVYINILVTRQWIFVLFYLVAENLRGWQTMKCLICTAKHNIINSLVHGYISYCHTNWLVCE